VLLQGVSKIGDPASLSAPGQVFSLA